MAPAIVLDRVTKQFPGMARPAVAELSLTVEAGELVVILGTSGSGKTTLLKMINRLHEPTAGRIEVDGVEIRDLPPTLLRRRIGYVIQQVGLFPHQTVARNIATVPRILGWDRARIAERVDFLLDLVRLPPEQFRHRRPRQLSGGQQQRVGIARALAGDPPILLMDEPFGALDAITRASLREELRRVQRRLRKTVLFVTHDVDEALELADRIVVMDEGRLVQVDTPLGLLARPATDFVRELLDTDDLLRHLVLRPVDEVMTPLPPGGGPAADGERVPAGTSLRRVVSALLRGRGRPVTVVDEAGRPVGQVTWEQVQGATTGR